MLSGWLKVKLNTITVTTSGLGQMNTSTSKKNLTMIGPARTAKSSKNKVTAWMKPQNLVFQSALMS